MTIHNCWHFWERLISMLMQFLMTQAIFKDKLLILNDKYDK
jgi:hypothetical protein